MAKAIYRTLRPHAGICVKQKKPGVESYTITDETGDVLVSVKPDTLMVELNLESKIFAPGQEEPVAASGRFFITAETCYPYHVVMDVMDFTAVQYVGYK